MSLMISFTSKTKVKVECCVLNCGDDAYSSIELYDCEPGYLVFRYDSWLHGKGMSGTASRERKTFLEYFDGVENAFMYVLSKSKSDKPDIIDAILNMWRMPR